MNKGYFDGSSPGEWIVPIPDKEGRHLDLRKGRTHKARNKDPSKPPLKFKVRKVVWGQRTDMPEMVSFIAEIEWEDGTVSCRLCYYIFNRKGKWAFGQYGPMMPAADLRELYEYAHEKGVLWPTLQRWRRTTCFK